MGTELRPHLIIVALLLACEAPAGNERAGNNLNGKIEWPSFIMPADCDWIHQTKILDAARATAHWVRNEPSWLTECLKDSIMSFESWSVNPNFPEDIMARVGTDTATTVRCRNLDHKNGMATGEVPFEDESVWLDKTFLDNEDVPRIMSVLLHEVGHAHGYHHPKLGSFPAGVNTRDYSHSPNEQLEQCMLTLATRKKGTNPASPHGRRRSSLTNETTLAKVGGLGGQSFELGCPAARYAFGLDLRTGDGVDSIGLRCRPPFGAADSSSGTAGGGGGGPVTLDCQGGELLVGLHGRAGAELDSVGPTCASAEEIRNNGTGAFRDPEAGGGGGAGWDRQCPPGMALRGLRGRGGQRIDQLELECKSIFQGDAIRISNAARIAPAPGVMHHTNVERCAGRSALVGLTLSTGNLVDRLGGLCSQVATETSGRDRLNTGAEPHILPANGGSGGAGGELLCAPGEALVGLTHRTGNSLDAIGPICADSIRWSDLSFPQESRDAGSAGGGGGGPGRTMCPRGSFMVGWTIDFSIAGVFSLVPQCRDF